MSDEKKPIMGKAEIIYPIGEVERLRAELAAEKEMRSRVDMVAGDYCRRALAAEAALAKEKEKHSSELRIENEKYHEQSWLRYEEEKKVAALTEKVAAGWAAFRTYGGHAEQCFQMTGCPCSCGFDRVASEAGRVLRAHDAATQKELLEALREFVSVMIGAEGPSLERLVGLEAKARAILANLGAEEKR